MAPFFLDEHMIGTCNRLDILPVRQFMAGPLAPIEQPFQRPVDRGRTALVTVTCQQIMQVGHLPDSSPDTRGRARAKKQPRPSPARHAWQNPASIVE
jgi:hypothetical protein